MRLTSLSALMVTFIFSTSASAADNEKVSQCRKGGSVVLFSWHQLDLCIKYNKMQMKEVRELRNLVFTTYQKLKLEVETRSALSERAKELSTAVPYDFSRNQNAEVLTSICNTSVNILHIAVTRPDWVSVLSCWR